MWVNAFVFLVVALATLLSFGVSADELVSLCLRFFFVLNFFHQTARDFASFCIVDSKDALPGQHDQVQPFYVPKKITLPGISRQDLLDSIHHAQLVAKQRMEVLEPKILENGSFA